MKAFDGFCYLCKKKGHKHIFVQQNNLVTMQMGTALATTKVRHIISLELATIVANKDIICIISGKKKKTSISIQVISNLKLRTKIMAAKKVM